MSIDDLNDTIESALGEHGAAADRPAPEFSTLLAAKQRRIRRGAAVATIGIAVLAGTAIVITSPGDEPELVFSPPSTAVAGPAPSNVRWFCSNPLGTDDQDRELFGTCETAGGGTDGDHACTIPLGKDEIGRSRFARCVEIGTLGPQVIDLPGADAPYDNPDAIPVRPDPYVVQVGDYGIKVAVEHCVSLQDLTAANGWSSAGAEFPGPDSVILIPRRFDESACEASRYTVTENDTARILVAERFCVGVQAMDQANRNTPDYEFFPPGLEIIIPPAAVDNC